MKNKVNSKSYKTLISAAEKPPAASLRLPQVFLMHGQPDVDDIYA